MNTSSNRSLALALVAGAVASTSLAPRQVAAQELGDIALDRFDPAPAGDDFFQVQGFRAGDGDVDFGAMVLGEYAHHPLTVHLLDDELGAGSEVSTVVSDQLFIHIGMSIGILERLQLSIDLPVAVVNRGNTAVAEGVSLLAPTGSAVGDLRAGFRLRLFGERDAPIGAAIGGYFFIPTGDDTEFTSNGSVRGQPALMLGGRAGPVVWGVNSGVMIQERSTYGNTLLGTNFTFGGGVALATENRGFQVGPELYGATLLDKHDQEGSLPPFDTKDTTLEAILGVKGRLEPFVLGGAAGPGITRGAGTAQFRAVLSVAYAPEPEGVVAASDRDGDGVFDEEDACPDAKGNRTAVPATNGCPDRDRDAIVDAVDACPDVPGVASADPRRNGCPPDRDGDGILDAQDACPDVKGIASSDRARNGCPPDRDGDGITDDVDACPDVVGVASAEPARNGCPLDTDGDGILDDKDACPKEPGQPNADPAKNGCPLAYLQGASIVISEQVQFQTGSHVILPASDALLDSVKNVLTNNPKITKVLIEGHTDNVGGAAYNQGLSQRRAASVRAWLVSRGVDDKKLDSKGFGFDRPIGDNTTPDGRQTNRRVEFKVLAGADSAVVAVEKTGTVPTPTPPPAPKRP